VAMPLPVVMEVVVKGEVVDVEEVVVVVEEVVVEVELLVVVVDVELMGLGVSTGSGSPHASTQYDLPASRPSQLGETVGFF